MTAYAAGLGVTTRYTLDGSNPLVATSGGNPTTFFYGLGPVAESNPALAYLLTDVSNTPRQLTDPQGNVTLSGSYTPWGSLMEIRGTGNFTWGYFGGLMDAATGLMYVGNGQYYDPATGRFFTRDAQPFNTNPYVPWVPIGTILLPMSLLSLYYIRKKNIHSPWIAVIVLALIVSACCPINQPATSTTQQETPQPATQTTSTPQNNQPATVAPATSAPSTPPANTPPSPTPCPSTSTPTPTPTPTWEPAGHYDLSAYYVTHESQYYSGPDSRSRPIPSLGNITANKYFLFSKEGICMQGTGKLTNGNYVGCVSSVNWNTLEKPDSNGEWLYTMPPDDSTNRDNIPFFWKTALTPPQFIPYNTIAVCSSGKISHDGSVEIRINDETVNTIMKQHNADNIFTSTDVGGNLCSSPLNKIDIFLGEQPTYQEDPGNDFYKNVARPIININDAYVEMRTIK